MRALSALCLLIALSAACAAAPPPVSIEENASVPIAGHGVGLGPITTRPRFKQGKRVSVVLATLYVHEGASIRKQEVEVGDDFLVGGERWLVVDIVPGGEASRGVVRVRRAD